QVVCARILLHRSAAGFQLAAARAPRRRGRQGDDLGDGDGCARTSHRGVELTVAKRVRLRKIVLMFHLFLGLTAALVVVVIGLTGAALAFNNEYGRWTHRDYFGVKATGAPVGHDAVVAKIEAEFAPSQVESINFHFDDEYV